MDVINLNEVYKSNALYYWCNCTGDLNIPGYPPTATPDADMLPNIVRAVYDNFWSEGRGTREYVVTYNGVTGLMLGWLFDYGWLDLGIVENVRGVSVPARKRLHNAVKKAAERLVCGYYFYDSTKPILHQYPVFYGEETDPDGDEILMFFPYDELRKISEAYRIVHDAGGKHVASLSERLYRAVGTFLTANTSADKDRTYEVTEFCPHCESEVTMTWNTDTDGFKAFCPHCGNRLMLCDECKHADEGDCDHDSTTDSCRHNKNNEK